LILTEFDLHTHHHTHERAIFNRIFGQKHPETALYSAGLHPWYLTENTFDAAQQWLLQQTAQPQCVAVGEAGLDKICDTDWDLQLRAFEVCIETAISLKKPLVIHCVRAYEAVLAIKKTWNNKGGDAIPWIFHGFNKKPEVAEMLLRAGTYLSFGAAILSHDGPAARSLRICPPGHYFFETDDRADVEIGAVYEAAREILGAAFIEPRLKGI
jgi:TatD DNase family protein